MPLEAGYVAGGMCPRAAAAIVAYAAEDVASLVTSEPTREMLATFLCALDLEALLYVRRNGAESSIAPAAC